MLSPGVRLGGRYALDERIASGGMGDVWRGTDEVLGRTVAVKALLPALMEEPGFAERFRGEARTMATINHPGVVDIYDYGSDEGIAFLVMEYVEGDALSRTLHRVGRLTPARTMALVAQAADALHAAHDKGIVHRDVKPGNLLVRPNGTLVLTDFGIARSAMVSQLTAAGSVLGTASYISPEQAAGAVATPASDVYSLGVVAYQCLSGHRPFEGDNPLEVAMKHVREQPRQLPGDIPPAVRAIVERAMAKDPATRWPTAAQLAAVSRQASVTLAATPTVGHPQAPHHPVSGGGRPISGGPVGHSAPGSPITGQVAQPVTGPPQPPPGTRVMPPYPPQHGGPVTGVPMTGGPYQHGGAVPPPRPGEPPYGYHPQPMPGRPPGGSGSGGSRAGVIVLIVLLVLLILLACGGGIWYVIKETGGGVANGADSTPSVVDADSNAVLEKIDCEKLRGAPYAEAAKRLKNDGFTVARREVPGGARGRVADVPCSAPKGSEVSVRVYAGGSAADPSCGMRMPDLNNPIGDCRPGSN